MTHFKPIADEQLCSLAHHHALQDQAPYAVSAYRKRDLDLRKRARGPKLAKGLSETSNFLECLKTPPVEGAGEPWFKKRWELGEATSVTTASKRIATEAEAVGAFGLNLGETVQITASAAVRWGVSVDQRVLVGIQGTGYHALASLVAGRCRDAMPLSEISEFDGHVLELHVAATLMVNCPGFEGHVDALLKTLGRSLLPGSGREAIQHAQLLRLAGSILDQSPGEVARIASGLHQGRTDRLHRAWSRGFFVPRGVSLPLLMERLTCPPPRASTA